MKGEPAILARVDKRFNIQMFHKMYAEGGKVVFGAWPSLHAAWPYLIARFKPPFGRKVSIFLWAYVALVWWAAIYLQHHFAADVLGGVLYAEASYWFVRFFMEPKAALKDSDLGLPFTIKQ